MKARASGGALARRVRGWRAAESLDPMLEPALRATLAMVIPLAVARLCGRPDLGLWASLAAFNLTLAGNDGPYRERAVFMGRGIVLLALAVWVGTALGASGWQAAVAVGVAAAIAGWIAGGRRSGAAPGLQMAILLLLATSRPASAALALSRALAVAAGGSWAMLMALLLWPMRPFQPL